jgi:hypothetical protein
MNLNSLYIGTVLNNSDISDVENEAPRGQVKVLINGISQTSNGGDQFGFPFGKNIDTTVSPKTKELVDDYEIWAYVLSPVTGGGGSLARYNASKDLAIVSDTDFPTSLDNTSPAENYTNFTVGDGFTGGDPSTAGVNSNGNSYTPDNRTNQPKGLFAVPNVGDVVLVSFINSSRGLPVVLGVLHGVKGIQSMGSSDVDDVYPNYPLGNNIV